MKHVALILACLALCNCAETAVSQLGANRYRVTTDNHMSTTGAESAALGEAQAYCASQNRVAEARITETRPYTSYVRYASASAEFTCVGR